MDIGANIREIRESKRISQAEAARRAGLKKQQLSKYEAGDQVPGGYMIAKIAAALEVPPGDLFEVPEKTPSLKAEAPSEEPGPLERILDTVRANSRFMADPDLPNKLQDMPAAEALMVARAAVRELELVAPEVRRRYEVAPPGTTEKAVASRELEVVSRGRLALRWAIRARFGSDPEPVPPMGAAQLADELKELDHALAVAG